MASVLRSVADIEGPWTEPDFDSSLIRRCRQYWNTPIRDLPNQVLATFIRQEIGLELVVPEGKMRLESCFDDDSELYDGELARAVSAHEWHEGLVAESERH